MSEVAPVLVCFAVPEEAKAFEQSAHPGVPARRLITGIGQINAETAIKRALASQRPELVLSCGFAGGLRAEFEPGTVIFDADGDSELERTLITAGANPGRFHCSKRIITTAAEKQGLWKSTGADAVEMESQFICGVCRKENIPGATVRVILDPANEDLPLDFNAVMNARQQLDYARLALALMKSPGRIPALLRLQKQTHQASKALAEVLLRFLNSCNG